MPEVRFRYIVNDVDAAVEFYTKMLGFKVEMHPGPGFANLSLDGAQLYLNRPGGGGGAGQSMPDGQSPTPGGWNRIQLVIEDIESLAEKMKADGVNLRSDIINGNGGKQVVVDDPSGNPIELFQPH